MIKRVLLVLVLCVAVAGVGSATAEAGRECDGLIVCIPVAGPWVQVFGRAEATNYQLACPGRGQVIGGLDADRAGPLGISFLGTLGGPVGPGVTTGRAAVFVAQTTRALSGFRPRLGCIPGGGGGGRGRTVYKPKPERRLTAAAPVPEATVWRVKNVRLKNAPSERVSHGCLASERLLSFSSAVAFRTAKPPSLATLGSVRATPRRAGGRVVVSVRSAIARPVATRVEVQVLAVCVRGPR
ncbi:MAG: hypothetical protein QOF45_124 [Gaiellaceae bacterium]|nr:hypothetical protein [Gaiellaceae bacterium]